MRLSTREFIQATGARHLQGDPHTPIEGVSIDTRTLKPGDFFFAIRGPRYDGHEFLADAVSRGAAGLVVQTADGRLGAGERCRPEILQVSDTVTALQRWARFIRRRTAATVIGITGSNGKTTTKEMLAAILKSAAKTLSTRGNLNNHLGLPLMLTEVQPDHRFVVLEMGASRAGDIALLAGIAKPQIGVITNIGRAHRKGLKYPEGVLQEKRALLDVLPVEGSAVLNQDDACLEPLIGALHCRTVSFGLGGRAEVRAEGVQEDAQGLRFTLDVRGHRAPTTVPALGGFQIYNALAAAAAAQAAGVTVEEIARGLAGFTPVAMRMQKITHPSGAVLIHDAYNANPSSVRASIEGFCRSFPGHKRWLVLGDMRELGPDSPREHEQLGAWLTAQAIDRIFLYGRDVRHVLDGMRAAVEGADRVERFRKKRLLAQELHRLLAPQTAILFKGSRVMKLEDIITAI